MECFNDDFDFSEMDKNPPLYVLKIKKGIGEKKIETSPIIELDNFIALRSKSYAYSYANKEISKKRYTKISQEGKLF